MKCEFCEESAYKTDGNSRSICYNRAYSGRCEGHIPYIAKKEQGRNDLCKCNSGKKFKKCCIKI